MIVSFKDLPSGVLTFGIPPVFQIFSGRQTPVPGQQLRYPNINNIRRDHSSVFIVDLDRHFPARFIIFRGKQP